MKYFPGFCLLLFISVSGLSAENKVSSLAAQNLQQKTGTFAVIEYAGGSWDRPYLREWMDSFTKTCIPDYLKWLKTKKLMPVNDRIEILKFSDPRIFDHPFLYIGGHYRFKLTSEEKKNLKEYLARGGLLYMDCYGKCVNPNCLCCSAIKSKSEFLDQMKELFEEMFPGTKWTGFGFRHASNESPFPIYVAQPVGVPISVYDPEKNGIYELSAIDELDSNAGFETFGIYSQGRLISIGTCSRGYSACMGSLLSPHYYDPYKKKMPFKLFTNLIAHAMSH